jgi:hypothetical protein
MSQLDDFEKKYFKKTPVKMTSAMRMEQRAVNTHVISAFSLYKRQPRPKNDGGIREILDIVKIVGVSVVYTIVRRNL